VLNNLVAGSLGSSTDDVGLPGGLFDSDCILTDILKPDVVEIAGAEAVDTFSLVGADDYVSKRQTMSFTQTVCNCIWYSLDCTPGLNQEDCIRVSALSLPKTRAGTTVEPDISTCSRAEVRRERIYSAYISIPSNVPVTVIGALKDEVFGGVGNVQLAARLTNGGASASRRTNSSTWATVGEGAATAEPKRDTERAARATYGIVIIVRIKLGD
jgi:hypothetical protein